MTDIAARLYGWARENMIDPDAIRLTVKGREFERCRSALKHELHPAPNNSWALYAIAGGDHCVLHGITIEKQQAAYRPDTAALVELITFAREKLQIECGGLREYKGGYPTQVLFPRIDAALASARGEVV
jgi:hypothetical protein